MNEASIYHQGSGVKLYLGDALQALRGLAPCSVDCVVTSPPYWGHRDYGIAGQYGHEERVEDFVEVMRSLFAEVRRMLKPLGTCWLNLGDSYGGSWGNYVAAGSTAPTASDEVRRRRHGTHRPPQSRALRKSLIGVPWRVAFALQEDGWLLRNSVVWHKPNARPESVRDRLGTRYESVFFFAMSNNHYFAGPSEPLGDVWKVPAQPFRGHTAVGPVEIARRAIRLGCPPGGVVLDPFSGTATTGLAARQLGCSYIGVDLNPAFHDLAIARFAEQEEVAL
ncbi:methyltransferase [Lentzea sp. NBRC 105346]|uniref:DNA-methyltransferase n=1 Tax=Lentzea sp. NBRC 105346 TaxID=3032205 RepID=UPI0024A5F554|nr:site-specific DNA-methyltransferase [Lentzea sp. NBRC 105346]GLZ32111.1 methyltransferase [Lentzea sp. NBRC 105346]